MDRTKLARRSGESFATSFIFSSILLLLLINTAFAQPYVHERSFGTYGEGPGQFQQVTALAQDSHGHYIILDNYAAEFQVCTDNGICTEHDTVAKAENQAGGQWGLAVNSMDEIFITNQYGNVEKCTHDGTCEVLITEHDGLNIYPYGIAIDAQDRIYIADVNYARILVCNSAGNCSSFGTWGTGLGQFNNPYGLVIRADGKVLISDFDSFRVQACDHLGNCEYTRYDNSYSYYYGGYGQGIALLPSGTMITTGYGYAQVNACAPGGVCRVVAQYDYNNPNYLQSPAGVMVNDNDRLVIGDYGAIHFLRPNVTINAGINDAWIEGGIPGLPGQGLLVSVFENIPLIFIAWFTYESARPAGFPAPEIGEWGHRWVTMQGGYTGNVANLDIYLTQGGVFESSNPPPDTAVRIGSATLTLHNCHSATLDYSFDGTNYQGTKNLIRIAGDNVPNCQIMSGGGRTQ